MTRRAGAEAGKVRVDAVARPASPEAGGRRPTSAPARPRAAVIGAGIGGLAAAIRLAQAGAEVDVWERAPVPGGKLREVEVGGRRIDAGPTVLTMPWVFEELFAIAGSRLADHVTLLPVEPACRHFFPDGSRLDLFNDPARSRAAIRELAGERAARGFDALRAHAATIFGVVRKPFLESPRLSLGQLLNPLRARMLPGFLRIDSGRALWAALEELLPDERLRVLYGRYATYNGSSPFHCPATLAVIIHVEQEFGVYVVRGGLYGLSEALAGLARTLGVRIHLGAEVERVRLAGKRVAGIVAAGEASDADIVVANCDALQLHGRLLDGDPAAARAAGKLAHLEPSLSAYVLLATAAPVPYPLAHHNVFFSRDYRREFGELIDERRAPAEPTVYVCAQDRAPGVAPGADERHLLLTNAPAEREPAIDWDAEAPRCRERLLGTLARSGLSLPILAEHAVTPRDFARLFPGSRGSLYGASSNSRMAAFERPENRVPGYRGLYLAGGSAHPGAGLPMVALSARIAAEQAIADFEIRRS